MRPLVIPRLSKTGEYAQVVLTIRQSRRHAAGVQVRFSLPRRSMFVAHLGDVEALPRANGEDGLPLAQMLLCMN